MSWDGWEGQEDQEGQEEAHLHHPGEAGEGRAGRRRPEAAAEVSPMAVSSTFFNLCCAGKKKKTLTS